MTEFFRVILFGVGMLACTHVLHGQIFSFETDYDNVLSSSSAYLGDDWDEIEVEIKNNFFLPATLVLTRIVLSSDSDEMLERFCLGELCFPPGTDSSPPMSLLSQETVTFKANYLPNFQEGTSALRYCLHTPDQDPSDGNCLDVAFSYNLDGFLLGCTNDDAMNYNIEATFDDGSCEFSEPDCSEAFNEGFSQGIDEGSSSSCSADLDGDNSISIADLLLFLAVFGSQCLD